MHKDINPENVIVCRCEGVSLKEILDGINTLGLKDLEEIKRVYRCGMGACQGRTCQRLLIQLLREHVPSCDIKGTGKFNYRPPLIPVNFQQISEVKDNDIT